MGVVAAVKIKEGEGEMRDGGAERHKGQKQKQVKNSKPPIVNSSEILGHKGTSISDKKQNKYWFQLWYLFQFSKCSELGSAITNARVLIKFPILLTTYLWSFELQPAVFHRIF